MRDTISATGENFGHFESESAILSWNSRFSSRFVKIQGFQGFCFKISVFKVFKLGWQPCFERTRIKDKTSEKIKQGNTQYNLNFIYDVGPENPGDLCPTS